MSPAQHEKQKQRVQQAQLLSPSTAERRGVYPKREAK